MMVIAKGASWGILVMWSRGGNGLISCLLAGHRGEWYGKRQLGPVMMMDAHDAGRMLLAPYCHCHGITAWLRSFVARGVIPHAYVLD
jgi:hypothetical protein